MSLKQRIDAEIKKAMLSKENDRLRALRGIKSLILLAESEKENRSGLSEKIEWQILTKAAKQRKDSAEIYNQQSRNDLAEKELLELKVIEEFLPKQMLEEEIEKHITDIIRESGAEGMKDMGKVMGIATKRMAGKADGRIISEIVKKKLS
jgi:hypothetical protein